jgi:SAM-dependent methyltransferase
VEARVSQQASRQEVEEFLSSTRFSGYQGMPLPHGLHVPGKDRVADARRILEGHVEGRSVLDVGTNYGAFPLAAIELGASSAVGVEADAERARVAQRIAELHGGRYEVRAGVVEELDPEERYDVVTIINVLHHVLDPLLVMRRVAQMAREKVIVEFCLADDPEYILLLHDHTDPSGRVPQLRARLRSFAFRAVARGLPVMAVASREYDRTFYFSPEAFRNLFVVHHKLFAEVEFAPSPEARRHAVAVCHVA